MTKHERHEKGNHELHELSEALQKPLFEEVKRATGKP
jgi:hypothetical protein